MKNKIITKIILNSVALALSIAAVVLILLKEPMGDNKYNYWFSHFLYSFKWANIC